MNGSRILLAAVISVGLIAFFSACGHGNNTSGADLTSGEETTASSMTPTEAAINMTKEAVSASMSASLTDSNQSKALPVSVYARCVIGPHGTYACPGGGSIRIDGDCLLIDSSDCALILDPLVMVFDACVTNDGYTIDGTLALTAILFMPGCSADAEPSMALNAASENLVVSGSGGTENISGFDVTITPDGIEITSDSAPGDSECASNADCQLLAVPLICNEGNCQPPCSSDNDCRDGAICIIDPINPAWGALGFTGLDDMGICGDEDDIPDEICDNGIDDDLDQDVDCDDLDCIDDPACIVPEICNNGKDDDRDGLTDCNDSNCFLSEDCEYDCDWDSCQFAVQLCTVQWPEICDCPSGDCSDLTIDQYCTADLWDDATCVNGCCKTVEPVCDLSCAGAAASCIALVDEEWCLCIDPVTGEEVVCDENFTGDWCTAWWWDNEMTCMFGCCVLAP